MEEKAVTLTISEWDYVCNALAERPFKEVNGLLAKVVNQLNSKPPEVTDGQ